MVCAFARRDTSETFLICKIQQFDCVRRMEMNVFFLAAACRAVSVAEHIALQMPCVNGTTLRVFRFVCARKDMSAMAFNNALACHRLVMSRTNVV